MAKNVRNKTIVKLISSIVIVGLVLSMYLIFFFDKLEILVFNHTGHNIDSLMVGDQLFNVKNGDSLYIDNCKSILIQGGLPFGKPNAIIHGKTKDTFEILLCGTGVEEIKKGLHKFNIIISEINGFYMFHWERHQ